MSSWLTHCQWTVGPLSRLISSAIFSAIMTVVRCVLTRTTLGMIEASMTRSPGPDHAALRIDDRRSSRLRSSYCGIS
jgi:hypothetical protein